MRDKYAVSYHYPIVGKDGKVKFTTSKTIRFKFHFTAWIVKTALKLFYTLKNKYHYVYLMYIPKYSIDTELGIEYQDAGPWRSYHLYASGDSIQELIEDSSISEIDQDGGELDCYGINETYKNNFGMEIQLCDDYVRQVAVKAIREIVK